MNEITRQEFEELRIRVERHEERLGRGDTNLALLNQRLEGMEKDISEVKLILKSMQERPAKRWDGVVGGIINWAVAALLAYLAIK